MTDALLAIVANPKLLATISSDHLADPEDKAIVKAMEIISDKGNAPTPHAIRELIKQLPDEADRNNLSRILDQCLAAPLDKESDPEFIIENAKEDYNIKILFDLGNQMMKGTKEMTSEEIVNELMDGLGKMASTTHTESIKDTVEETLNDIIEVASGKKKAYWPTGDDRFDEYVAMCARLLIVVAAQKKIGKTRFIVDRVLRLYRKNKFLNFIWYSLEMRPSELIVCMIAWITGHSTRYISGKDGPIEPEHLEEILRTKHLLLQLPIRFVGRSKTVDAMCRDIRRWVKGPTVVIIDNIGLVELMPNMTDTQNEDHIAKRLQALRDELDLCIIALHHLSKESESRFNKDDHYRPKVTHVRGSSRIIDYANQLWLLHRPGHYKDLKDVFGDSWEEIKKRFLVDIAINRDGEAGEVMFTHDLASSHFKEA
jgi:replicative DNA helicase